MFFWLVRLVYDGATLVLPVFLVVLAARSWPAQRRRAGWFIALALVGAATRVYATHIEPSRLTVRRAGLVARPGPGELLRIVHLSDIQTDAVGDWEARVVSTVKALEPDLVVHTGDLLQPIEPATVASELPKMAEILGTLAPTPAVTVEGDVDGWMAGRDRIAGMQLLVDRDLQIELRGRRLSILGLSLARSAGGARELVEGWLARQPPGAVTLVVGHRPDFALELEGLRVDLALAGHTHGGQIRLPLIGPIITLSNVPREWARGFRRIHGDIHLDVSAGIGSEHAAGLPAIRFFCPPELTLLEVR